MRSWELKTERSTFHQSCSLSFEWSLVSVELLGAHTVQLKTTWSWWPTIQKSSNIDTRRNNIMRHLRGSSQFGMDFFALLVVHPPVESRWGSCWHVNWMLKRLWRCYRMCLCGVNRMVPWAVYGCHFWDHQHEHWLTNLRESQEGLTTLEFGGMTPFGVQWLNMFNFDLRMYCHFHCRFNMSCGMNW